VFASNLIRQYTITPHGDRTAEYKASNLNYAVGYIKEIKYNKK